MHTTKCKRCGKTLNHRDKRKIYCDLKCYRVDPLSRLMLRVTKQPAGCWNLAGYLSRGYPRFVLNGKRMSGHVASWILHRGSTEGKWVLHKCISNRRCVNPDHLYLGTSQDNSDDMVAQGHLRDQCGSKNDSAKLDEEKVRQMRAVPYFRGMYVHYAKLYGVEISVVRRAIIGKTWSHVK